MIEETYKCSKPCDGIFKSIGLNWLNQKVYECNRCGRRFRVTCESCVYKTRLVGGNHCIACNVGLGERVGYVRLDNRGIILPKSYLLKPMDKGEK